MSISNMRRVALCHCAEQLVAVSARGGGGEENNVNKGGSPVVVVCLETQYGFYRDNLQNSK